MKTKTKTKSMKRRCPLETRLKGKRKKRTKNNYFTKVHEDAIVKYALSVSRQEKSKLYISLIQPAFDEMVNKIIFTYKFNNLPNIDYLRDDCKIWLTTILDKYITFINYHINQGFLVYSFAHKKAQACRHKAIRIANQFRTMDTSLTFRKGKSDISDIVVV